jgi:hypothetical protein
MGLLNLPMGFSSHDTPAQAGQEATPQSHFQNPF